MPRIIHEIKCDTKYFVRLKDGSKTAELRFNDRDYQVGDMLIIRQDDYDASSCDVKFRQELYYRITHIIGSEFIGLKEGYVVLSIAKLKQHPSMIKGGY